MFSLKKMQKSIPQLAAEFCWQENPWPQETKGLQMLQIGCGTRTLKGFINVDAVPEVPGVLPWNLLNIWPEACRNLYAAFSEDVLEHFYREEQLYILTSMNTTLQAHGVFRVLMPNFRHLLNALTQSELKSDNWLSLTSGYVTRPDLMNYALRFSGHSWLHNEESFSELAKEAGFEAKGTSCAESAVPELCNLNLRDEISAISFATDLKKVSPIKRIILRPSNISNLAIMEHFGNDGILCQATSADPLVKYELPQSISAGDIALVNVRGSNLSCGIEHNYAQLYVSDREEESITLDSSLRSCRHANIVRGATIAGRIGSDRKVKVIRFDPSRTRDDIVTIGPLELFVFEQRT